jgi:hypothetical protein
VEIDRRRRRSEHRSRGGGETREKWRRAAPNERATLPPRGIGGGGSISIENFIRWNSDTAENLIRRQIDFG